LRLAVLSLSVLVVIAAVLVPLINLGSTFHIPSVTPPPNPPTTPAPAQTSTARQHTSAAQPHQPPSYLTASGLRAGLARIARLAPRARLAEVRVAADSLIASAGLPSGKTKEVVLQPTGTFVISEPSTGERFLPISQIKPSAVARIVAGMRARFHVPVDRIDYIVLSSPVGVPTQWITFTKAPGHPGFAATLGGTQLARLPG
jgi:hypothetical protein